MAPTKPRSRVHQRQPRTAPKHINRWTDDQRTFLLIINSADFSHITKTSEQARIFNKTFQNELEACGFPNGLSARVLDAQYRESKREGRRSRGWERIRKPTTANQQQNWHQLKDKIEAAIDALSLHQSESARTTIRHSTNTRAREKTVTRLSTTAVPETRADSWTLRKRTSTKERAAWIHLNLDPRAQLFEPAASSAGLATPRTTRCNSDDDGDLPANLRKSMRKVVAVNPSVQSPQHIRRLVLASPPKTQSTAERGKPRGQSSLGRLARATITYDRPYGETRLLLTPEEFALTQQDLIPITPAEAHPPQPRLLFRWWSEGREDGSTTPAGERIGKSAGMNTTTEGFRSALSTLSNIAQPPPPCEQLDWDGLIWHLNRFSFHSPYISTSCSWTWVLRLALKEAADGNPGYVSIINRDALPKKGVYHVYPYHKALSRKFPFVNGAHRYRGTHEFICWKVIEPHAVLHSVHIKDLIKIINASTVMSTTLQLHLLAGPGCLSQIQRRMRAAQTTLSISVIKSLATLSRFLGLYNATYEQLSHFLSSIFQCGFMIGPKKPSEWSKAATAFSFYFCEGQDIQEVQGMKTAGIKIAFLDAIRWGCCSDLNSKLRNRQINRKLQRKATSIGLECPAQILSDELNAIKMQIWSYEHKQQDLIGNTGYYTTESNRQR